MSVLCIFPLARVVMAEAEVGLFFSSLYFNSYETTLYFEMYDLSCTDHTSLDDSLMSGTHH